MRTSHQITLGLVLAAGLGYALPAHAQMITEFQKMPFDPVPSAQAANPYGARYIPGVGFRYVTPGYSPRVYGYRAYAPSCGRGWVWNGDTCVRLRVRRR